MVMAADVAACAAIQQASSDAIDMDFSAWIRPTRQNGDR